MGSGVSLKPGDEIGTNPACAQGTLQALSVKVSLHARPNEAHEQGFQVQHGRGISLMSGPEFSDAKLISRHVLAQRYEQATRSSLEVHHIPDRCPSEVLLLPVENSFCVVPAIEPFSRISGVCELIGDRTFQERTQREIVAGDFFRLGSVGFVVTGTCDAAGKQTLIETSQLLYLKRSVFQQLLSMETKGLPGEAAHLGVFARDSDTAGTAASSVDGNDIQPHPEVPEEEAKRVAQEPQPPDAESLEGDRRRLPPCAPARPPGAAEDEAASAKVALAKEEDTMTAHSDAAHVAEAKHDSSAVGDRPVAPPLSSEFLSSTDQPSQPESPQPHVRPRQTLARRESEDPSAAPASCYVCCDDDAHAPDNPLVSACVCKGDTKWMHLRCLQRIIYGAEDSICMVSQPTSPQVCMVCKTEYRKWCLLADEMTVAITQPRSAPPWISFRVITHNARDTSDYFDTAFQVSFAPIMRPDRTSSIRPLTIGRSHECDVELGYQTVSAVHALLNFQDGKFFLQDNGSSNGTLLYIKKPLVLRPDKITSIRMGRSTLQLTPVHSPAEPPPNRPWLMRRGSSAGFHGSIDRDGAAAEEDASVAAPRGGTAQSVDQDAAYADHLPQGQRPAWLPAGMSLKEHSELLASLVGLLTSTNHDNNDNNGDKSHGPAQPGELQRMSLAEFLISTRSAPSNLGLDTEGGENPAQVEPPAGGTSGANGEESAQRVVAP